jgi:hypothetical protein
LRILRVIYDVWREAKPIIRREVRKCNAKVPKLEVARVILSDDGELAGACDAEKNAIIISAGVLEKVSSMFKLSERSLKCLILCLIMHEVRHYVDIVCNGLRYDVHRELMEKRAEDYGAEWLEKCLENP